MSVVLSAGSVALPARLQATGFRRHRRRRSARNVAEPQRPHRLQTGQPPQLRVLGLLADDWVLHDGVTEVIHHRRDGEDAAQRSCKLFSGVVWLALALSVSAITPKEAAASVNPMTTIRRVREVETACVMVTLLARR